MNTISVNFNQTTGRIKPLHGINNGPVRKKVDQYRTNQDSYKAIGFPYARTHDASFCPAYGGEHSVDVHAIFPDFSADPYDPASYDFHLTNEYMELLRDSNTEAFYRLGSKIEHESKKYGTLAPLDFKKWAVICEHIIRHMNEGWGNGHHFNIRYWEIWNEPDMDRDDSTNKRCWGGTEAEFFEFYKTAACHLKQCFPDLKIGGPAVTGNLAWSDRFLKYMAKEQAPVDFFSWHIYTTDPDILLKKCSAVRDLLDSNGFTATENVLNEWNYVRDWFDQFLPSVEVIISMKGAAFTASCILGAQHVPLDLLMYYDAQPCIFNGLWDYYTLRQLKGYYPFLMFSELYKLGNAAAIDNPVKDVKAAAAVGEAGQAVMLSCYNDDDEDTEVRELELALSGMKSDKVTIEILDEDRTMEKSEVPVINGTIRLTMAKNSVVLVKNF